LLFRPDSGIKTTAEAQKLMSDLRYVRDAAALHQQWYRANIDLNRSQITLTNRQGDCITGLTAKQCTLRLASGIKMVTENLPDNYIAFNHLGEPYMNNHQPLQQLARIILQSNRRIETINIVPETGMIFLS
jgi:N-formylglutamate amidohydrolase